MQSPGSCKVGSIIDDDLLTGVLTAGSRMSAFSVV